jgi:hypothetical protein
MIEAGMELNAITGLPFRHAAKAIRPKPARLQEGLF